MTIISVRKSKLYPNRDTVLILNKTLGCCRFVWNQLLAKNNEAYMAWKDDETLPKPNCSLSYFSSKLGELKNAATNILLEGLRLAG